MAIQGMESAKFQSGIRLIDTFSAVSGSAPGPVGFGADDKAVEALGSGIVEALRLAGVASGPDLAEMLGRQADSEFEENIDALMKRGDVVRLNGTESPLYVAAEARLHILADHAIRIGPPDETVVEDNRLADSIESLYDLLGPPSWRYTAETLEEFVQLSGTTSPGKDDGWMTLAEKGADDLTLDRLPESAPEQIRRLATLTADWQLAARAALNGPLRIWAGFVGVLQEDPAQARLVALPPEVRAVVSAGPGTGKTHTIRERLVHLLGTGVPAPAITVIAYSRAAVSELHARVPVVDGEIVDIRTLDSTAGLFVANATEDVGRTDYESTIRQATELLSRDDRIVRRWLDGRRHLIVDEAQDIVGSRRTFLKRLVDGLPKECGVTVFGDSAQAIYGYSEREAGRPDPVPIDEVLTEAGFERHELGRNHRTTRSTLRRIASEGRRILSTSADGHAAFSGMRNLVSKLADGAPPTPAEARPLASLALFRSGGAAARHAVRMGDAGIRVHLADRDSDAGLAMAPAWLGRAMANLHGRGVDALAAIAAADPSLPPADTLAAALAVSLVGGRYDSARMTEAMRFGQTPSHDPPVVPVASTIHAAKGREAEDVELHLPEPREGMSETEAAEEARVLYVGATRARRRLYIAPEMGTMRREGARYWRTSGNGMQVQVRAADAADLTVLAEPDGPIRIPLLRWTREGKWGLHVDGPDGDQRLASFGSEFHRDLTCIFDQVGSPRFVPVARGRLRAEWRTLVRDGALEVAPVAEGFVWINFARTRTL